jgi:hypothetical protein
MLAAPSLLRLASSLGPILFAKRMDTVTEPPRGVNFTAFETKFLITYGKSTIRYNGEISARGKNS